MKRSGAAVALCIALVSTAASFATPSVATAQDPHVDSDGDGLLDEWEINGYPSQVYNEKTGEVETHLVPIHKWGADPNRKDLFLQLNWMEPKWKTDSLNCDDEAFGATGQHIERFLQCSSANLNDFEPSRRTLRELELLFAEEGIALHIDAGDYVSPSLTNYTDRRGGGTVAYENLYLDKHTLDEMSRSLLKDRFGVFRVGLIGDTMYMVQNSRGDLEPSESSGLAQVGGSGLYIAHHSKMNSEYQVRNTILHELGHTLGLNHTGSLDQAVIEEYFFDQLPGDSDEKRREQAKKKADRLPGYCSVMNYNYQWSHFDYSQPKGKGFHSIAKVDQHCDPKLNSFGVPADWTELRLKSFDFGTNAGDPVDAQVIEPREPTAEELKRLSAPANNGQAGFRLTNSVSNGIVVNRKDNKIVGEIENLGIEAQEFTVIATYPGGSSEVKRTVTTTEAIEIPINVGSELAGPSAEVQIQIFNAKGEETFDSSYTIPVLDLSREQLDAALRNFHSDASISDDLKQLADERFTSEPEPQPEKDPATIPAKPSASVPSPTKPTGSEPNASEAVPSKTATPKPEAPKPAPSPSGSSVPDVLGAIIGAILALTGIGSAVAGWWFSQTNR